MLEKGKKSRHKIFLGCLSSYKIKIIDICYKNIKYSIQKFVIRKFYSKDIFLLMVILYFLIFIKCFYDIMKILYI